MLRDVTLFGHTGNGRCVGVSLPKQVARSKHSANLGNKHMVEAFRDRKACESRLLVNRHRLGLNKNTHDALFRAFQVRADVIVHLEDDTVPSPDALRYFD